MGSRALPNKPHQTKPNQTKPNLHTNQPTCLHPSSVWPGRDANHARDGPQHAALPDAWHGGRTQLHCHVVAMLTRRIHSYSSTYIHVLHVVSSTYYYSCSCSPYVYRVLLVVYSSIYFSTRIPRVLVAIRVHNPLEGILVPQYTSSSEIVTEQALSLSLSYGQQRHAAPY